MNYALSLLGWLLSPTRKIVDIWKRGPPEHSGRVLRFWNMGWFLAEVALASVLVVVSAYYPSARANPFIFLPLLALAWSRVNEVAYAFYRDALSRLAKQKQSSDLSPTDRIRMAMKSYLALGINFALIFHFLPLKEGFTGEMRTFFDALYFSGVTLATLGYGDISPINPIARTFALYEVFAGILLVAVAIATYIGASGSNDA